MVEQISTILDLRAGQIHSPIYRFCDTSGDGTGRRHATGNYSTYTGVADTEFKFSPAVGELARIERMLVMIRDTGTLDTDFYGVDIVLTGGIQVGIKDTNGTLLDLLDGQVIMTNLHWGRQCFDAVRRSWGSGDEFVAVRWSFFKSGFPLRIKGDEGEYFAITLNDNLSGLVDHTFLLQGFWETAKT